MPIRFPEALSLVDTAIGTLKIALGPDNPNMATALAIKVSCCMAEALHAKFSALLGKCPCLSSPINLIMIPRRVS